MANVLCWDTSIPETADFANNWESSIEWAMDQQGNPVQLLERCADSLPNPKIIASGDLANEFDVYLARETSFQIDEIYRAYLDHIENRLLKNRSSDAFPIGTIDFPTSLSNALNPMMYIHHGFLLACTGPDDETVSEEIRQSYEQIRIHEKIRSEPDSPHLVSFGEIGDFKITLSHVNFVDRSTTLQRSGEKKMAVGELYVYVTARCSGRAMDDFVGSYQRVAQSHFRSIQLLGGGNPLDVDSLKDFLPFFVDAIRLALIDSSNKDTFERRIANAARLLVEADHQSNHAIGLALCITAIDALLGKSGAESSIRLADAVAGLLEPEVVARRRATEYFLALYNLRSRVLHGESLKETDDLRKEARLVAIHVLYSVWSHLQFFEKFSLDESSSQTSKQLKPEEFFRRLREDFVKPGLPMGVMDANVRELWRKPQTGHY